VSEESDLVVIHRYLIDARLDEWASVVFEMTLGGLPFCCMINQWRTGRPWITRWGMES